MESFLDRIRRLFSFKII